jgi:hypothetical protein
MRTCAVAEAVLDLGGRARIVLDDEPGARALRERGLDALSAAEEPRWTSARASGAWLDGFVDWSAELGALAQQNTPGWVVENRTPARERCARVVYPALHHGPDDWDRRHSDRVLAGAAWIPLARDVRGTRPSLERDVELLVTFGGSDPLRSTERVLAALPEGLSIVASVGPHMAHRRRAIEELAARCGAACAGRPASRSRRGWRARASPSPPSAPRCTSSRTCARRRSCSPTTSPTARRSEHYRAHGPHRPLGLARELDERQLTVGLARGLAEVQKPAAAIPELGQGAVRIARALLGSGKTADVA